MGAQVAEVFRLMPATKENRLRNYLDKKRKLEMKARKRAEREAALGVGSTGGTLSGPAARSHSAVPDPSRIKRSTAKDWRRGRSPRRSSPSQSSRRHRSRSRRRRSSSRDLRRRLGSRSGLESRRSRNRRDNRGRSKDRRDLPSNDLRSRLESGGNKESPPEDLRAKLNESERLAAVVEYDWPEHDEVMRVVPEERRIRDESRVNPRVTSPSRPPVPSSSFGKKKRRKGKRAPNDGLNMGEGQLLSS